VTERFRPMVSVVIPTRNRPTLLSSCVGAITSQATEYEYEIVIANDGDVPVPRQLAADPRVVVVEASRRGPAAARNTGIAASSGEIILLTDDDVLPQPGWLNIAVKRLEAEPSLAGVLGRVFCEPFDALHEYAVESDGLGSYLTCNAAYRRWALEAVGGFDEAFPFPHCEDRDIGYRIAAIGEVVYEESM
jgi:glycosyltransferase involved in cell wall biosynthesis